MSVDVNCFAGPYFACLLKNENKIVIESENVCPNTLCVKYKQLNTAAFCSFCGSKIVKMDMEWVRDSIDIETVDNLLGDSDLYCDFADLAYTEKNKLHIWHDCNDITKGFRFRDGGWHLDCFPVVTAEDLHNQKKFFLEKYEKEYKVLKEVYGEDQVEIRWGIFNSYSC